MSLTSGHEYIKLTVFSKPRAHDILAILILLFRTYSEDTFTGYRRQLAQGNMTTKLTCLQRILHQVIVIFSTEVAQLKWL